MYMEEIVPRNDSFVVSINDYSEQHQKDSMSITISSQDSRDLRRPTYNIRKELLLHQFDSVQNIIKRPTRPAGYDLSPNFLWDSVTWIEQTPIWAGLGLDPFEVLDLAPSVLMVETVVVQSLWEGFRIYRGNIRGGRRMILRRLSVSDQTECLNNPQ